jgi:hypothetical protein
MSEMMTFRDWTKAVDRIIAQHHGFGSHKIKTWPARQAFDDGLTPDQGYEVWAMFSEMEGRNIA